MYHNREMMLRLLIFLEVIKKLIGWKKNLKSPSFKSALVKFLVTTWKQEQFGEIFKDKILYVNSGNECYRFYKENSSWKRSEVSFLYNTHEETDSRMIFHLSKAPSPNQAVI